MSDFDLFDMFDEDDNIKEDIKEPVDDDCKDGNCIICGDLLEVCLDRFTGIYEPILCSSCSEEMVKFMNKK